MDLQQVKIKIKRWEYEFIEQNKRPPDKNDIRHLNDIRTLYKLYSRLKKRAVTGTPRRKEEEEEQQNVTGEAEPTPEKHVNNATLGPTPQIYGKAISIFEMKVSPLRPIQETPTTEVEESENDEETPRLAIHSVKKRLFDTDIPQLQVSEPNNNGPLPPRETSTAPAPVEPKTTTATIAERYGPNSPLRLAQSVSIRHSLLTPSKLNAAKDDKSMFSPSPLIKKHSSKTLFELANEHKKYVEEVKQLDLEFKGQIIPIRNTAITELEEEQETGKQKRRRGVLRRLKFDDPEGSTEIKKDLHKELHRLKTKKLNKFMGYENEHSSSDEAEEAKPPTTTEHPKRKRPKKYNLVSNNFRRLNLPRKNRNPRFRRR